MSNFKITAKAGNARAGILKTAHGDVLTPVFMPVGTQGTVKALSPDDLKICGAQIILGNTYHLYLRPGHQLVKKMGGLHQFMRWDGPILTDSGGFQAFSLGAMIEHGVRKVGNKTVVNGSATTIKDVIKEDSINQEDLSQGEREVPEQKTPVSKITEEGIHFVSHLDGKKHLLTPDLSIDIQLSLGSDVCLVLDELLSPLHNQRYVKESLERTHRWELASKKYFQSQVKDSINPGAQLFGILQGVYDQEIRINEAKWVANQDFDGVSIGGSFGTSEYWKGGLDDVETNWAASKAIYETVGWVTPLLPVEWPKHILGIGEVKDLFECVERGADMFDCVAATRRARNGSLYISPKSGGRIDNKFTLLITNSEYREDSKPIDKYCSCYTCQHFSKAYLRHLYLAKELLYYRLASIHNISFLTNLMGIIRESIVDNHFQQVKTQWLV